MDNVKSRGTKVSLSTRFLSLLLALLMLMSVFPLSVFTAFADENEEPPGDETEIEEPPSDDAGDESEIMPMANAITEDIYNNIFLDALEFTGYNVEYQRSIGTLLKKDHSGWYLLNKHADENAIVKRYNIKYLAGASRGTASKNGTSYQVPFGAANDDAKTTLWKTVTSATGKIPDIEKLRSEGIECGGYVSYVFLNYLPNVEGIEIPGLKDQLPNGTHDPDTWETVLQRMVKAGQAEQIAYTKVVPTSDDWLPYDEMEIGDIIIMGTEGHRGVHVAIYAGTNKDDKGRHFMTHIGNNRGPEIAQIEDMNDGGPKSSVPLAVYRLPINTVPHNQPGKIKVTKNTTNHGTVAGWKFTIYSDAACKTAVETITTGSGGTATSKDLEPGTYYVKETGYPSTMTEEQKKYWTLDPAVKTVEVIANRTATTDTSGNPLTFTNDYDYVGNLKIIKTTTNGGRVDGWTFWVSTSPDIASAPYPGYDGKTDANGVVEIKGLSPGTYYICEHAPYPDYYDEKTWTLDTRTLSVTVEAGKTATVTFQNTYNTFGKLSITKTSTNGGTVQGWQFTIYSDSACRTAVQTITTNASGYAESGDLTSGVTYYIKETGAPAGVDTSYWVMDTSVKSVTVVAGKTTAATTAFKNEVYGKLSIRKTATNGGQLNGWTFGIYTDAECTQFIQTITTDASGYAESKNLAPGTYYIKEEILSNPPGVNVGFWEVDHSIKSVTVVAGKTTAVATAFANRYGGKVRITKTTTNGGTVDGWQFTIYSDAACTQVVAIVTAQSYPPVFVETGEGISPLLDPGTYYVKETGAPPNIDTTYWILDTHVEKVTIKAGELTFVTFNNQWAGKLELKKTSTNGGTVAGWLFSIYTDNACTTLATLANGSTAQNLKTDSSGSITSDLNPGTYYVKEVGAPEGVDTSYWEMDASVKTVTVEAGKTTSVTFNNQWLGKVEFKKTATNGGTVAGWKITVYYDKACTQKIGTYTTGSDGTILTTGWQPGTYYAKETGAPTGVDLSYWVMDTPVKTFTIKAGQTSTVTFNNQWFGRLAIRKTATPSGTVEGWQFTVYSDAACRTVVQTLTTNKDGYAESKNLTPGNTYYIKETAAPAGVDTSYWVIDTSVKSVTIEAGKTLEPTTAFVNHWYGKVSIDKALENPEAGSLEGWLFTIYTDNACTTIAKFADGTPAENLKTDSSGHILSEKLERGTYWLKEVGYEGEVEWDYWFCSSKNNPQQVTVTEGATANVKFRNALRPGTITVTKVSDDGSVLKGVQLMLEWYDETANEWKPVTSRSTASHPYVTRGTCTSAGLSNGVLITGADGTVTFDGLYPLVQYRVTEVATLSGYQLLTEPVFVGKLTLEENLIKKFKPVNHKLVTLPVTGRYDILIFSAAAIVLTAAGTVVLMVTKRRRMDRE